MIMVKEKIQTMNENQVAILDAAILIEAGWDKICNEVWLATLDDDAKVERIMQRDGKSKEQAMGRIKSQSSDEEKFKVANVCLSSKWDHEFTFEQCEKAWKLLLGRI